MLVEVWGSVSKQLHSRSTWRALKKKPHTELGGSPQGPVQSEDLGVWLMGYFQNL